MQHLRSTAFFCLFAWSLTGCSGLASAPGGKQDGKQTTGQTASQGAGQTAGQGAGQTARQEAAQQDKTAPTDAINQLIDTTRLKGDMNNLLNSIASGRPDTNLLKRTAKDVLSTTHDVLSDSGIDQLYGNSNDPAVRAAAETLKKYRNAMGATPAALDSMKKAADLLKAN